MVKISRITRVNEILKREIAELFERGVVPLPASSLISVTQVQASNDLRHARVFISLYGAEPERDWPKIAKALARKRADLQKKIAGALTLKYTPVLEFKFDDRLAVGDHVLSILEADTHEDE